MTVTPRTYPIFSGKPLKQVTVGIELSKTTANTKKLLKT